MTLAWDLLVWAGVALLLLGVRSFAQFERRRGYDEGWADAMEHYSSVDPDVREPEGPA